MKKSIALLLLFFLVQISFGQSALGVAKPAKEFRFAFQGGYSYRIAPLSPDTPYIMKDYVNSLKSGYNFGFDAAYFIQPAHGFGLKYSRFSAKAAMPNMDVTFVDGSSSFGTISDNIAINFIGPSYLTKYELSNPAHVFFGGLSLGYLGYQDKAMLATRSIDISGSTFGAAFDLGYDFSISKYITLGAQASLTGGALSKIKYNYGSTTEVIELAEENRENLSRLDLSAGLRFKI